MPPKRTTRRSATPQRPTPSLRGSPAPSTPGSGRRRPPTGEDVRTALPAKFSTSYGSPMSQLPNRATLTSSINIEDAAANIFSNVSRYNREARRLLPPRESRPSSVPRILEAHDEAEEEDELSQDQQPELKNDLKSRPEPRQFAPVPQSNKADSQQESIRDSHKRGRDNDAEKQDEQERLERDAKLKQQREAQARRRAEQKRIKAEEAAHEQAEQQRQKEEQDRLARDVEERAKAEQERIAQETLARQKKAEQDRRDRLAREEAERQKAEQDKRAEQDRRERLAREEAERQKAEQDKRAEQDRRERLAREEAERQKAEQDKRAEQVRRERLATEEATRQKAEQDRRERLAREEAERQKAEKARLVKETERRGFESRTPTGLNNQRFPGDTPSTVRTFTEESQLYNEAVIRTPRSPGSRRPEAPMSPPLSFHDAIPQLGPSSKPTVPTIVSSAPSDKGPRTETSPRVSPARPLPPSAPRPPGPIQNSSGPIPRPEIPPQRIPPLQTNVNQEPTDRRSVNSSRGDKSSSTQETTRPQPPSEARKHPETTSRFSPWALLKYLAMVFIGAFVLLHTLRFLHIVARPDMFDKSPIMRLDWYGWSDWERNIGQFFPSPLLHPLGVLTDRQYDDLERFMRDQKSSTAAAVQNIESILPRMVHVQKRNGKLVIDDEFWHALKNMIQHENSIFTLEGTSDISDTHWKALQGRFRKAGIPGQAGISASDVEDIAGRSVSRYWDTWVKNNHKKVTSILGDNLSVDLEKKLRSETEKLIDNKLASKGLQDVIITKDQFMREIEKAMKDQKKDIDRQLEGVRSSLKTLIEEASKSTSSSVGMTREEITDLVNAVVKKSISNAKLEAAAQSNIGHFYNTELSHRINHCSMGNGALIEISMTSPTWTYSKPAFGTKAWVNFMQKQPRSQPNSFSVLTSWEDAGQCWCAGTKTGKGATRPADVSIRLANFVVPQNIVIEHIDPSATLDPLAMPKDLEIWARYDEYGRHERMTNWMAATFPDANDTELRKLGFVQIGAFTYESKSADRGIFITRLSSELVSNEGATDHILVRAVNNHGTDHTCFYRIRMYGDVLELPAEKQSKL